MTDKLHLFSTSDAQRIDKAVKAIEKQQRNTPQITKRDPIPVGPSAGFWAKITAVDAEDMSYSWTRQKAKDDGTFEDDSEFTGEAAGDRYAFEVSDSVDVPIDTIVWMRNFHDYFVFEWGGGSSAKLCKAVSSISSNATGDVNEWELGPSEVDPVNEFEAYNPTDNTIPTDVLCLAVQVKGGYILIPLQCPG